MPDESLDLTYLDPPFKSSRSGNLLFKHVKGDASVAQTMAIDQSGPNCKIVDRSAWSTEEATV